MYLLLYLMNYGSLLSRKEYMNNYQCTLKTIDKLIIFLEKKDPNAVVIFQADHGVSYVEKKDYINEKDRRIIKSVA